MRQLAQVQPTAPPDAATVDAIRSKRTCRNCGGTHPFRPRDCCPAYNSTCHKCGKKNHWQNVCRSTGSNDRQPRTRDRPPSRRKPRTPSRGRKRPNPKVHYISEQDYESEFEDDFNEMVISPILVSNISAIHNAEQHDSPDTRDEVFTFIEVKRDRKMLVKLRVKVDTGAQGNTIPLRMYRRMFPDRLDSGGFPSSDSTSNHKAILTAYNNTRIKQYGSTSLPCRYDGSAWVTADFFVVDSDGPAILGLPTSRKLQLVTLHCAITTPQCPSISCTQDLQRQYPDQFDRIGNFPGKYHIVLDENAHPTISAPRKCPIKIKDELKSELENMEQQGVIRRVTEPTDWVSSLTVSRRENGKLRVCLDPKDLNNAIKRCHHKTPTIEEITHKFSGAKFFSKLDAKNGYWSVKLDDESALLTTFNSPFGRYCYLRLPFGLVMSQDVFQLRMDQFLESCPGAIGIADDIVVFGATEAEHDKNLHHLMKAANQYGLMFNSSKCAIKTPQIKFFGMIYDKHGVHPDPAKVTAIKQINPPQDKTGLQEFLGMVTYLSPFIPNLSDHTSDLRALLKKDIDFIWSPSHQRAFEKVKDLICAETILTYFDPSKKTTIQVDASMKGLGAALTQDGKPVAFASKSLSPAEQRYANIERELLAVVFGCERFHTYIYGDHFTVESDHKPLEMIQRKSLKAAPPRLQRMLLRLQPYDVTVTYRPGNEMLLPDGLSRLPVPDANHIDLDLHVTFVQFTQPRNRSLQHETALDTTLMTLKDIIIKGWPERRHDVPKALHQYWPFRDELAVEDGLIVKGECIIIPASQQQHVLLQLHEGHQGSEKTKLRAKECVFWVGITKDIDTLVKNCPTCQRFQTAQPRETLLQHTVPTRPWQVVGTDLFFFEGDNFLIVADYYSKFPFIRKLPVPCTSQAVVNATKQIFAEQGIPERVVSDNARHYDSKQYKDFSVSWCFDHITSSPHYPRSNGFIERTIQTVKKTIRKARSSDSDVNMALLCLRTTPVDHTIPSPAQILYNRKLRGNLPAKIRNSLAARDKIQERLYERQSTQKQYHDRQARDLPPLRSGQTVSILDPNSGRWTPATVAEKCHEPRSYIVRTPNGSILRRNRRHIRDLEPVKKRVTFDIDPQTPSQSSPQPPVTTPPRVNTPTPPPLHQPTVHHPEYKTRSGRLVRKPEKLSL